MTQPAPDSKTDPIRAAIDSTFMLVAARFFLPAVIAMLGWLLQGVLGDLKLANQKMETELQHLSEQQMSTQLLSAGVTAKLDSTVKQLDRLQTQVDQLRPVDGLRGHN